MKLVLQIFNNGAHHCGQFYFRLASTSDRPKTLSVSSNGADFLQAIPLAVSTKIQANLPAFDGETPKPR
jgi:hypothetical protein